MYLTNLVRLRFTYVLKPFNVYYCEFLSINRFNKRLWAQANAKTVKISKTVRVSGVILHSEITMSNTYTNVPILIASNYNNWRFRTIAILRFALSLQNVIDEDPPADDAKMKGFIVQDAKTQSFMIQGISDKHLDVIKDSETSKEQMTTLKDMFVRTSSKFFTKLRLWRKLFKLKSGTIESLEDHFIKFDTIIRDLKDLGSTIDETDPVSHLLLSFPSQYDTVITALETVAEVKMDFVKAGLVGEELKLMCKGNVEQNSGNDFSLKTYTGCYICGDKSSFKAQCPKCFVFVLNSGAFCKRRNAKPYGKCDKCNIIFSFVCPHSVYAVPNALNICGSNCCKC